MIYEPLFEYKDGVSEVQSAFCFDQQKRNMLALIGSYTLDQIHGLPVASDIHEFMDKQTRTALMGRPLAFVDYWMDVDNGGTGMMQHAPPGYLTKMRSRARLLEKAMHGVVEYENVIQVNFRKAS